ncbi:hypothetical protein B0H21DRAFT_710581 [Amylocystis lapponica]|nr:hypothetical protein B0H21DRAFT_710581 [Amylocystis lapponica]
MIMISRAPRLTLPSTLPSTDYREILEGDRDLDYDCSDKQETKQVHENSAPVDFINTILNELRIGDVRQAAVKQATGTGLGIAFWGDSEFEWRQLTEEPAVPRHGIVVHPIICDDIEDIRSHPHVAEVLGWSDKVFDRGSGVKQTPPTPVVVPSLLSDVVSLHTRFPPGERGRRRECGAERGEHRDND